MKKLLKSAKRTAASFVKGLALLTKLAEPKGSDLQKKVIAPAAHKLLGKITLSAIAGAVLGGVVVSAITLALEATNPSLSWIALPFLAGSALFAIIASLVGKYLPACTELSYFYFLDTAILSEDEGMFSKLLNLGQDKGLLPEGDYGGEVVLSRLAALHIMRNSPVVAKEYPARVGAINPSIVWMLLRLGGSGDFYLNNSLLETFPSSSLEK